MDVAVWLRQFGRPDRCRLDGALAEAFSFKDFLGRAETKRYWASPSERQPRCSAALTLANNQGGNANYREVPMASAELLESVSGTGGHHRKPDRDENLIGGQACREVRPEQVACRHDALAPRATDHHFPVERTQDGRILRGWVCVRNAPADRST
jgi:hypothetical protein